MQSTGGEITYTFGYLGTSPAVGDFDGDGIDDFAVYNDNGGKWYILQSEDGYINDTFGYLGTVPAVGDFDGDGIDDLAVYHDVGGMWYIFQSSNGTVRTVPFGYMGTVPAVGDFDGDGIDDLAVYDDDFGMWYIYRSEDGFQNVSYGYEGTVPAVGDFDGDNISDLAVYCSSNCRGDPDFTWYIFQSSKGPRNEKFGYLGTVPAVGDFDGDGIDDLAVYDDDFGMWYIWQSSNGVETETIFGPCGDGIIGLGEVCDCGTPWDCTSFTFTETCWSKGFAEEGTLDCNQLNCHFDTSGCSCTNPCTVDSSLNKTCEGNISIVKTCEMQDIGCLNWSLFSETNCTASGKSCNPLLGTCVYPDGIDFCSNFLIQEECNACPLNGIIATNTVNLKNLGEPNCGEYELRLINEVQCNYTRDCKCEWNSSGGCGYFSEVRKVNIICGTSGAVRYPNSYGKCYFIDTVQGNCSEGDAVEISWTAWMNWSDNSYSFREATDGTAPFNISNPADNEEWINTTDGKYHYNPVMSNGKRYADSCQEGQRIAPCPQKVKLPFFTWVNFIMALGALGIIYSISYSFEKSKRKSKDIISKSFLNKK